MTAQELLLAVSLADVKDLLEVVSSYLISIYDKSEWRSEWKRVVLMNLCILVNALEFSTFFFRWCFLFTIEYFFLLIKGIHKV